MPFALIGIAAFAIGAGAMWLGLRGSESKPHPSPAVVAPVAEPPPDVSALPPANAALSLANWNYDRQNWPHAIDHYQQAISLGIDNADVRTDLGNCFRFTAAPLKALEQYQLARRQNPQHENSLFNIAGLYDQVLHDPAKAADAWREYLRRFPTAAGADRARQSLGEAELGEKHQVEALKQLIGN